MENFTFESVTLDRQGNILARTSGVAIGYVEVAGSVDFEMVHIPGGSTHIGTLHGGYEDERPQHLISLAPFFMARALVTQALWQAVMGRLTHCRFQRPDLPVENVSWVHAQAFCRKLSKKTGRAYSLPSEAQWEHACRANTMTPFSTGETITTDYANYVGEHCYAQETRGIYRHTPTPAGMFLPNPFGLYDMHGNLWEWCADCWNADYQGAPVDGSAWQSEGERGYRVGRGGSWHEPPTNCRSATRLRLKENEGDDFIGFRVITNEDFL